VSEKLEHLPASAHDTDEQSNHDDEAARGLGDKVRDAGSQIAGHTTELLKEAQTRGASVVGASTLRTNDLQGLLGKLDDLARRQPAVFVGAAMAAGFAAVRLGRVAVAGATQADLPHMPEKTDEPK